MQQINGALVPPTVFRVGIHCPYLLLFSGITPGNFDSALGTASPHTAPRTWISYYKIGEIGPHWLAGLHSMSGRQRGWWYASYMQQQVLYLPTCTRSHRVYPTAVALIRSPFIPNNVCISASAQLHTLSKDGKMQFSFPRLFLI